MSIAMPARPSITMETELGTERRCPHCGDWWPLDDEFWQPTVKRGRATFHSWCRACLAEDRTDRRRCERPDGMG